MPAGTGTPPPAGDTATVVLGGPGGDKGQSETPQRNNHIPIHRKDSNIQ